ncbi:MAG: hypothetical protein SAqTSB_36350 [Shewanella algae]
MGRVTRLCELESRHSDMAIAQSKKELANIRWRVNPNDIPWMFWEPHIEKNLGRSARVYSRLIRLGCKRTNQGNMN